MSTALYDLIGIGYSAYRRPDPRIAAPIVEALGPARTIVNVGAGAGSYEPAGRTVVAVEPSAQMVRQRPPSAAPAVRAFADRLPFRDHAFDAAMAVLTIHHWPDWRAGVAEMRRVARGPVAILTWDADHPGFWLVQDYFPEILEIDLVIMPRLAEIERVLGPCDVRPVPIPADCSDGFLGAYWRRPERYLEAGARGAISSFAKIRTLDAGLARLRADLADGTWHRRHGSLLTLPELDIGYRLVVASAQVRRAPSPAKKHRERSGGRCHSESQ
jgi:SAM-dependent methyltransferase